MVEACRHPPVRMYVCMSRCGRIVYQQDWAHITRNRCQCPKASTCWTGAVLWLTHNFMVEHMNRKPLYMFAYPLYTASLVYCFVYPCIALYTLVYTLVYCFAFPFHISYTLFCISSATTFQLDKQYEYNFVPM